MNLSADDYLALVRGEQHGLWPGLARGGLLAASLPYGLAIRLRNRLFDRGWTATRRAAVPVVSVGNLTLGGTGKTPCVEYIARFYRERKRRVAILSRGYGARNEPNDEALVLQENLPDVPHLQGADRAASADRAVAQWDSEVLLLDDGFQHRRLARDLDVVLIDATQPWGYGRLFPRGLLREPRSGLRRAGVVMLTRCDQVTEQLRTGLRREIGRRAPGTPVVETTHRPLAWIDCDGRSQSPATWQGRPVAAFCGIGNPEAFRHTVARLGAQLAAFRTFSDHHRYTPAVVESLQSWVEGLAVEAVLTTQKDLVKIRRARLGGKELWALRIGLHVETGGAELERRLESVMSRADRA